MMGEDYLDNIIIEKLVYIHTDIYDTNENVLKISNEDRRITNVETLLNYEANDFIELIAEGIDVVAPILEEKTTNSQYEILIENPIDGIVQILNDMNVFFAKKINLLKQAQCQFSNQLNAIISEKSSQLNLILGIKNDQNLLQFNKSLLTFVENLCRVIDLMNSPMVNEQDTFKKRKFIKEVINQKLIYLKLSDQFLRLENSQLTTFLTELFGQITTERNQVTRT
jgi:hypothetical protein